jgi:tetratricopeptide (TPR) repeat protein
MGKRQHQAGQLAVAERIYRQILEQEPNHPDALHLLGALAGQRGNSDAAIDLIRRAIKSRPDFPEASRNLAALLAQKGQFDEAISIYRKILEARPDAAELHRELGAVLGASGRIEEAAASFFIAVQLRPEDTEAHNDLGGVLTLLHRFDDAIAACSKAIALRPGFAEAHHNLGGALRGKGMMDAAQSAFSRAIELKPNWPQAHASLAEIHRHAGRIDEALAGYRRALQLKPDYVEAHNNVGNILRETGKLEEAIAAYLRATQLQPDNAVPHFNLGQTLQAAGRFEEALTAYAKALRAKPDYFEVLANRAIILATLQRFEEALASHAKAAALKPDASLTHQAMGEILLHQHDSAAVDYFRRAVAVDPDLFSAWNGLGLALRAQGKFDEAAGCFRRMLEIRPNSAIAYQNLISTGRLVTEPADIQRLRALLSDPNLLTDDRIAVGFALAKTLDDADRFDEAFACYADANLLMKQLRATAGEIYDAAAFHRHIGQLIEIFTPQFFAERREWGEPSELPVFIVGMPRSGTSLVQQIAASHPHVHGAGELKDIYSIATSLGGTLGWDRESVNQAAERHLQRLRDMNPAASRVIDKMPDNVLFLGVIGVLLPKARIILCRRDARDVCLSCYFQSFSTGNMFSYDLAHCGRQYLEVDRLMAHWLRVLPLPMLEVQYEDVVADLEKQSRRLVDFLGLSWDPACLEFHRTQSTVLTSSVWQVRQPIYTGSVGRWRHYQRHLGPLLETLEH